MSNPFENVKNIVTQFFAGTKQSDGQESSLSKLMLADEGQAESVKTSLEQSVIADIAQKYGSRRDSKRQLELQWRLNIDFLDGNQYVEINPFLGEIMEVPPYTEFENRKVFNEIAANIEARQAVLNKRRNILRTRPASTSSQDRTSAMIGNKVLASLSRRLNLPELQSEANIIAAPTGSAIWKTVWDSSAGAVVGYEKGRLEEKYYGNDLLIRALENKIFGHEEDAIIYQIHEGDVVTTLHSPFEIYPENPQIPIRNQRRVMHVQLLSPDEIFEKWGVIEEGTENEAYKILSTRDRMVGGGVSGMSYGFTLGVERIKNTVKVFEEWELPTPRYVKGRLIICTEKKMLHYGPLPDALGEDGTYVLPFDVQQSIKTDGFFGKSVIERLIPVQQSINALNNRILDYMDRLGIAAMVTETGAIDVEYYREFGIPPGDIIEFEIGRDRPRYLDPPPLPNNIFQQLDNLLNQLDRLSGVSQLIKQSITPSGLTSGVGIAAIADQDDTRIGLEATNIKTALMGVGQKQLRLYHDNVEFSRVVKDIGKGKDGEYDVTVFCGNDLTSFDVFIEAEPEASDSLAQRRQRLIELINSGLFIDPETGSISKEARLKILEILQIGDWESLGDSENNQKSRATRENNAMLVGDECIVKDFDDDALHIGEHNDFRLKAEFEEASRKDGTLDSRFEEHVNIHMQNLQAKENVQQQQQLLPAPNLDAGTFNQEE